MVDDEFARPIPDQLNRGGEYLGLYDGSFTVVTGEQPAYLPECVMSFAYWNPDFLEQPRLLNPQTGEYVAVQVEEAGMDVLQNLHRPLSMLNWFR